MTQQTHDQNFPVTLNRDKHRFEIAIGGNVAYLKFEPVDGGLAYTQTVVPDALAGHGVGTALVRHGLRYARERGLKVRPDCPFVRAYIDSHSQWQDISTAHGK